MGVVVLATDEDDVVTAILVGADDVALLLFLMLSDTVLHVIAISVLLFDNNCGQR